jgi:hypothetical protein
MEAVAADQQQWHIRFAASLDFAGADEPFSIGQRQTV